MGREMGSRTPRFRCAQPSAREVATRPAGSLNLYFAEVTTNALSTFDFADWVRRLDPQSCGRLERFLELATEAVASGEADDGPRGCTNARRKSHSGGSSTNRTASRRLPQGVLPVVASIALVAKGRNGGEQPEPRLPRQQRQLPAHRTPDSAG